MNLSKTIPIVFNGGSYGTYLEWALTTLTTNEKIVVPFTSLGNSHGFVGNHLIDMAGWQKFTAGNSSYAFVRVHPKTTKQESLSQNLDCMLNTVDKIIYLYPDHRTKLLVINNYFTKVWNNWWSYQFDKEISQDYIYNNWPVDRSVDINDLPNWIKREFLSYYLMPSWHDQVEWYHPDTWQHPRCLMLTVSELLCDFVSSLTKIKNFCQLTYIKDPQQLIPYHNWMLSLQRHLPQDALCNEIVARTINDEAFEWNTLPLASEGWIQWELRNLGYEIRCDGLDTFPTDSIQLKNLLYLI
jgi:hypothetical protein